MNRNVTEAFIMLADLIDRAGATVVARGEEQREILSTLIHISNPQERVVIVPGRNNNIFAQIAETMWVLSGRQDMEFLSHYLPRALDFSDDATTWRAAYGPRIRSWHGKVDQVSEVVKRLRSDSNTKRAVLSIFDPALDYIESKDIPCNNWLQFIHRDGLLHLNVTVRANDLIWGFSGINVFEWSILHELLARSLGFAVGGLAWFVGTLHVYKRHYSKSQNIARLQGFKSVYEFGIPSVPIESSLKDFDVQIQYLFESEMNSRRGDEGRARSASERIADPFIHACAVMLRAYNKFLHGEDSYAIMEVLSELPESDFEVAAIEYFTRYWKDTDALSDISGACADYMNYYRLHLQRFQQKARPRNANSMEISTANDNPEEARSEDR